MSLLDVKQAKVTTTFNVSNLSSPWQFFVEKMLLLRNVLSLAGF